jgi:site-specific DNA-adenine methylase
MSISNFIFPWTGRKKKYENEILYNSIDLSKIECIVEPFSGSMSFSMYMFLVKKRENIKYIFNDSDENLFKFYKLIHDEGMPALEKLIEKSNNYVVDKRDKTCHKEKKTMNDFFITKARGLDCAFLHNGKKKAEKYKPHVKFIKNLHKITNKNYIEIFDKYKNKKNTLIYLDPPYFSSYNGDYYSQNDVNTDMTKILIDILDLYKNGNCKLVYIHNKNALMSYLFSQITNLKKTIEYKKIYQIKKRKVIHQIEIK